MVNRSGHSIRSYWAAKASNLHGGGTASPTVPPIAACMRTGRDADVDRSVECACTRHKTVKSG